MAASIGIIGCGWLGSALARRLAASGVGVVGTTASRESAARLAAPGIEAIVARFVPGLEGDVARLRDVEAIVVAIPPSREADPVAQARAVARVVTDTRATHVVHVSTTSVYPANGGTVVEDDALADHPLRRVEDALLECGLATTILRCAGLFGPGRLILPWILRSGAVVDERAPVNFVEQSDAVRAILRVLDEPVAGAFNVCADRHPAKGDFYRELARRAGLGVPRFGATGESWKVVDNRKFRERFDFRYEYPDPLTFPIDV
jgi:nucleoside-diphosphate-sugar epimerase